MKRSNFSKKEFKIKLMIVCTLLALVVLSFFFAERIEKFLNLRETYATNQVSENKISSAKYEMTYLDVGQGNSAFIKFPDGKTMLIDGGNTVCDNKIVDFLKFKNVTQLDYLIATHADADHIGGLIKVLEMIEVKTILRPFQIAGSGDNIAEFVANESEDLAGVYDYYNDVTSNRSKISRVTGSLYNDFIERVYDEHYFENGKKIFSDVIVFYDGLKFSGENYEIEFFAPLIRDENIDLSLKTERTEGYATVGYGADESNDNSAIFMVSCYGETFFFSGDASFSSGDKNAEDLNFEETDFLSSLTKLEREHISNVSVYLAGHHGSKFSSSRELVELLNPKFVVFSVGKNNTHEHPHSETLARVSEIDRLEEDYLILTYNTGNITFSSINGNLKYAIEFYEKDSRLTISWYELGMIIFISISYVVVLVKPKQKRRI